jgi:hypothetical protein
MSRRAAGGYTKLNFVLLRAPRVSVLKPCFCDFVFRNQQNYTHQAQAEGRISVFFYSVPSYVASVTITLEIEIF